MSPNSRNSPLSLGQAAGGGGQVGSGGKSILKFHGWDWVFGWGSSEHVEGRERSYLRFLRRVVSQRARPAKGTRLRRPRDQKSVGGVGGVGLVRLAAGAGLVGRGAAGWDATAEGWVGCSGFEVVSKGAAGVGAALVGEAGAWVEFATVGEGRRSRAGGGGCGGDPGRRLEGVSGGGGRCGGRQGGRDGLRGGAG